MRIDKIDKLNNKYLKKILKVMTEEEKELIQAAIEQSFQSLHEVLDIEKNEREKEKKIEKIIVGAVWIVFAIAKDKNFPLVGRQEL